jgi:hypothetical protein
MMLESVGQHRFDGRIQKTCERTELLADRSLVAAVISSLSIPVIPSSVPCVKKEMDDSAL